MKAQSLNQFLDTFAAALYTFLKIVIFLLLLLGMVFILSRIYTEQGVVILPFEVSKNENLSGVAIADQLTAELKRIQRIHGITYEGLILKANGSYFVPSVPTEQSLGDGEIIVPKAEIIEFSLANIGNADIGSNSLSLGNIIIAFKNICPFSKPVTIIRGSLQRYGSNIVLVAVLEGSNVQSWMVRQPIDNNKEEQLNEMIRNLTFMIAPDLPQSSVSAKTWEGLKYYTEALDAYHQYNISGNPNDLTLAGKYSLKAISSEKGYEKPFELLSSLETTFTMIGRQNDAIWYCNKTIELDPTSAYGWRNKGQALYDQRKFDEGIKAYDEAIRLDPKDAMAWFGKGVALCSQGKYNESIEAYDESIRLDPNAVTWSNKGGVLDIQRKYDEAIKAYDEAIRLNPNYVDAWINKG